MKWFSALVLGLALIGPSPARSAEPRPAWPPEIKRITYASPADQAAQPALAYFPAAQAPVPLLVALHTWSSDYQKPAEEPYASWCIAKGWAFIHPDFRGPNKRPEAAGSELVVQDILGAVEYAKTQAKIDPNRIYLMGGSGGGHAALLMAGRAPQVWAGVSAWVPIFDLKEWHAQCRQKNKNYALMMEQSCGGKPGDSPAVDREYARRSPSAWLENAANVPLDINTGIHDGHQGSVPVSQSLQAYNALANPRDRIHDDVIRHMTENETIPEGLHQLVDDSLYADRPVLFRRASNNARITIFDGGHEILYEAGLSWLEQQRKGRPAQWEIHPAAHPAKPEIKIEYPVIGKIAPRNARDIKSSNWSIGCEVMDRDYTVYKNWRGYLGPLGIKKARIQSGWAKTEKREGVYDFAWLDEIVRDMTAQGVKPWVCLCYGNPLYAPPDSNDKKGRNVAEIGGKLPLDPRAAEAWSRYVGAVVDRYKDVVDEWELWNEAKGGKSGAPDYMKFFIPTAETIRRHQPDAKILGFATAGIDIDMIRAGLEILRREGKLGLIDRVTYHPYHYNPDSVYPRVEEMRRMVAGYSPRIAIFQGENGAPSEPRSSSALGDYDWNEERQAKWALRRLLGDLGRDIPSSYFTICNYKYAFTDRLNTKGLLATNPADMKVTRAKPSYGAVQRVAAIFDDRLKRVTGFTCETEPPATRKILSVFGYADAQGRSIVTLWKCDAPPANTELGRVDLRLTGTSFKSPVYVDMLSGMVYEIPADQWEGNAEGATFKGIPFYDSVVLIAERALLPLENK